MDGPCFDRFAQQFALALTRRRLAAALLGLGLAGPTRPPVVEAGKKRKKKPKSCKKGTVKCGKHCVNTRTNARHCGGCNRPCGIDVACVDGECQVHSGCSGGEILCNGGCVDPRDNDEHCGQCDHPCQDALTCIDGSCGCASGHKCGTACVDTQFDNEHCGECNHACGGGKRCQGGQCVATGCAPGERNCGGGLCVPDDDEHCCTESDCDQPYPSYSDLQCNLNTHRCECKRPHEGRCDDFRYRCSPCCPGGVGLGANCTQGGLGEYVCVAQTYMDSCTCPPSAPFGCQGPPYQRCSRDPKTDPHRCGQYCEDCGAGVCCQGQCVRGSSPGWSGNRGPCGPDCELCAADQICCNQGPDTEPRCIPNISGFCYTSH